jgi:anthranilate synthase/aminodeoxychorismate synthase-like glutamine amidotransferase
MLVILVIDNFDSFTYNLVHAFGALGVRAEALRPTGRLQQEVDRRSPSAIVVSPGPGRPSDFSATCALVERWAGNVPILGVCLGHQCIAECFGGRVVRAENVVHGKVDAVYHDGKTIFDGMRNPLSAARYHSLVVEESSLPDDLEVSAFSLSGEVMGLRARGMALEGVQFHPESIATPRGEDLLRNFLEVHVCAAGRRPVPC